MEQGWDTLVSAYAPPTVLSLGRSIFDPIWREREHAGRHSELLHVLRGSVDLVMRDDSVHGEASDTIYTPARAPHRDVFPPGTAFEAYLVHFKWEGEAELLRRCTPRRLACVSSRAKARIAADFRQLDRDFQRQGVMARELAGLRLLQIILTLYHEVSDDQPTATIDVGRSRRRQIMEQTRQLIDQHFHEPLTLDTLAEALHISPYHLSHVFSAESGFTLSNYLTTVRMNKAAELLRQGRLSVAEVAAAVGYRDPQYFSRVFKAHYHIAPSMFRAGG